MNEILISFFVFLTCVIVAIASQIISPTPVHAENLDYTVQAEIRSAEANKTLPASYELDPEDPNPVLFAMAKDKLLPNYMTYLHPKYLTPTIAIAFTCVIMAIVVIFVDVISIAKFNYFKNEIVKIKTQFILITLIILPSILIYKTHGDYEWYHLPSLSRVVPAHL